jgi:hypothetical protein
MPVSCCKAVIRHALAHDKGRLHKTLLSAHICTPDARAGWSILKSLLEQRPKGVPRLVKDAAGSLITSATKSAERWHESRDHISRDQSLDQGFNTQHLADIAQRGASLAADPKLHQCSTWENTAPPTEQEISVALTTCANSRAAGINNIPFEAYRYCRAPILTALTLLFTLVWTWECHPTEWDNAHIIPLFKGGPDLCNVD